MLNHDEIDDGRDSRGFEGGGLQVAVQRQKVSKLGIEVRERGRGGRKGHRGEKGEALYPAKKRSK